MVAHKVRGVPRPVTAKPAQRSTPPTSILYSRQQLAERLRLAWRDRQQRPNLDIFLAHKSREEPPLSVREIITEIERNSTDEAPQYRPPTVDATSYLIVNDPLARADHKRLEGKRSSVRPNLAPSITISFDHSGVDDDYDEDRSRDRSLNVHLLTPDTCREGSNDQPVDNHHIEQESEDRTVKIKEPDKLKQDALTATAKRANFKNSSNSPVMSGSVTSSTPPSGTPPAKPILKKPSGQSLTRMMSAPAAGRSAAKGTNFDVKKIEKELDVGQDFSTQRERNIKSAPARRRFKNCRRKGVKSYEDESSGNEEGPTRSRVRGRTVEPVADVVTMMSLLSPTESEVEDTPPAVQLPQPEAGPEVETTTAHNCTSALTSGIVSLRKFAAKTGQ